ncbi:hypothetical protein [Acetonema longum]|uniref:hypothetical protein n=1 Tax=Acetonema longum TaxID=2374 RepID=UPI001112816F|nr:hypothetical protein [Acetonema longum]
MYSKLRQRASLRNKNNRTAPGIDNIIHQWEVALIIRSPYCSYEAGELDQQGRKIAEVYFNIPGSHIIYRCEDVIGLIVGMETDTIKSPSCIAAEMNSVYSLLNLEERTCYYTDIAIALHQCLLGDDASARNILNQLSQNILQHKTNRIKLDYLTGCLYGLVACIAAFALICALPTLSDWTVPYIFLAGAGGGFFSAAVGLHKISIDLNTSRRYYQINGMIRIFIAVISAWIGFLAIKADVIFGMFNTKSEGILLVAVLAGFSETFAYNILMNLESRQQSSGQNEDKTTTGDAEKTPRV